MHGSLGPPYEDAGDTLRLPQAQEAVLAVCGDEILVWMVSDADDVFLMNLWVQTGRDHH